jgi:hypothetical protein
MESRALPPAIVLVSDGMPTDDYRRGLGLLLDEPWGQRAVRMAVGIGRDVDDQVLRKFIGNPDVSPVTASNPEQLIRLIRWVSTHAGRAGVVRPAGGWATVAFSVQGSMHDRNGLPNQDAVATATIEGPVPAVVAAVADGHGGQRYVRSDVGSRLAVDAACSVVASWWEGRNGALDDDRMLASATDTLIPLLVERWRQAVGEDVARRPFTAEESKRAGAPLSNAPLMAYGATLLVAVATASDVLLLQLGDGDITLVTQDGRVLSPMQEDDRLVGGQTTSLCLDSAERDFRVAAVPPPEALELVMLSSDGYGNSFADTEWQTTVGRDISDAVRRRGLDDVAKAIPGWLADSADAGGDDVTVAVLSRSAPAPELSAPAATATATAAEVPRARVSRPSPPPSTLSAAGPAGSSGRAGSSRTLPWWRRPVVLVPIALLIGVGAGWFASGLGGDGGDDGGPQPVVAGSPGSTALVAGQAEETIVGPARSKILFSPTSADPKPRIVGSAPESLGIVTRLELDGSVWEVTPAGGLVVTASGQRARPVLLNGRRAGSLHAAAGYLWVVEENEQSLLRVDPKNPAAGTDAPIPIERLDATPPGNDVPPQGPPSVP